MQKYCVQDVKVTAKLYERILPFITNHPVLNSSGSGVECPNCAKKNTQKRGTRSTRYCRIQRNQCQDCGTWFETTRTRIKTNANE